MSSLRIRENCTKVIPRGVSRTSFHRSVGDVMHSLLLCVSAPSRRSLSELRRSLSELRRSLSELRRSLSELRRSLSELRLRSATVEGPFSYHRRDARPPSKGCVGFFSLRLCVEISSLRLCAFALVPERASTALSYRRRAALNSPPCAPVQS
jgi:hypothetical protein